MILLLAAIAVFTVQVQALGDPCLPGNHQLINEPHRSTLFVPESTDRLLCDRDLRPGWYVFSGYDEMPTSCVQSYHCGTHAPIWLHGGNPSQADGIVNREACVNYGFPSSPVKCCNYKIHIQVKNCGTYYVYFLGRTPGCPAAYCAGNKRVCNVGSAKNGVNCKDLYPKVTTFPKLGLPEVTQNNKVRFPCTVNYPTGEKDVAFEVTWTVDGHELLDPLTRKPIITTLTGDSRTAYLDVDNLQGNLDKNLRCNVTSYHPSTPGIRSDSVPSNPYFVGFKVSTDRLIVDEKGEEKEITIESTIPIPCNALNQQDCRFPIEVHQGKDPTDLSWTSCTFDLKKDPITGMYKTTIKVKATRDFITDHDKIHEIAFEPLFSLTNPVWMGYNISHIQIKTKDQETTECTLSGDPHLRGFDHKRNYNVYQEGDFLLYGTKHQSRPFEVQVRNWGCGSYHPCSCAVVAREGNDVIEIDMCEKRMNEIAAPVVKKLSNGPLDGTTVTRDKSGRHFYINFPSGARVEVAANVGTPPHTHEKDGYLTVHVQAPADDLGKTEGICGNWNGQTGDGDLEGKDGVKYPDKQTVEFVRSWKLPSGTSMFEQVPKPEAHLQMGHEYCACKKKYVDCSKGKGSNNPSKKVCVGGKCFTPQLIQKVTKRSYVDEFADEYFPENVRPKKHVRRAANFPTPSGITESRARQMCTAALQKASLYRLCQHMPVMQIDSFIDACVEDVKYADGDLFTIGHMNAFDMVCQTEVMKDVTRYRYTTDGEPIPPVEITAGRCPNQCSLKGTCIHGVCHCNHGYTSVDCSVKTGVPPQIHRLRGNGVCDIRDQPCSSANIIAENVMDSDLLLCKVVFINEDGSNGKTVVTKGQFINFLEVQCPIPTNNVTLGKAPTQGFKILLTTDGHVYSTPSSFQVYDSYCFQCEAPGKCSKKADSCLIDGKCYRHGDQNQAHQVCDPSNSETSWKTNTDVKEIDHYTASFTGCACDFDTNRFDCACCQNNGCPCGEIQKNQCTSCKQKQLCGKYPDLFPIV